MTRIITVSIIIACLISCSPNQSETDMLLAQAKALKDNDDNCFEAIKIYDKILLLDGNNTKALIRRSYRYFQISDTTKAITDINLALNEAPSNDLARFQRACLYSDINQYDKAITDFNTLIEEGTEIQNLYRYRAHIHEKLRNWSKAKDDFRSAIGRDTTGNFRMYINLGDCYEAMGMFDSAYAAYSQAISNNPNDPAFYNRRAIASLGAKEEQKGIADLTTAITIIT